MMYAPSGDETAEFVDGYIEAMCWANVIHESDGEDRSLDVEELPDDIEEALREEARAFLDEHTEALIGGAIMRARRGGAHYSWAQAGHDYALTRNRHGAGFWDRGLGMLGDALTTYAKPYGSSLLIVAADGSMSLGG